MRYPTPTVVASPHSVAFQYINEPELLLDAVFIGTFAPDRAVLAITSHDLIVICQTTSSEQCRRFPIDAANNSGPGEITVATGDERFRFTLAGTDTKNRHFVATLKLASHLPTSAS